MDNKKIRKRKDCFLGMHGDFHAMPEDRLVVGETLKEEDIREYLELLKPDFIQIDCKGHPGYTSYPSKLGNAMPEFKFDTLALWRRITKEYGIPLYMHYSGVSDKKYCDEHPENQVVNADGSYKTGYTRLDSSYVDDLMIPQLCELAEKYEVNGVWIDGDCWAAYPDYTEHTIKKFEEKTGINLNGNPPKSYDDKYYKEYLDFTREQFRDYVRHYTDTLHEKFPDLEVCSNWAFSFHMPEKVCANVDFISGDLSPADCLNSARYAGRMMAQQNMAWDLMSWGFRYRVLGTPLTPPKPIAHLKQEAAEIVALGGAFQDNVSFFKDGSPNMKELRKRKELFDFLRVREPFCFRGKMIHQTAIFVPTFDRYSEITLPFNKIGNERFQKITQLFCDCGQSVETVGEHTLENHYNEYPLIVVPELFCGVSEKTFCDLKKYVEDGGNLLLIGNKTAEVFSQNGFGFKVEEYADIPELANWASFTVGHNLGAVKKNKPSYFATDFEDYALVLGADKITPYTDFKTFGYLTRSIRDESGTPFAVCYKMGKGKVAVVGADIASQYGDGAQYLVRELVNNISYSMYSPLVKVEKALGTLEQICLEKDGKLMIQLINANGNHSNPLSVTETTIPTCADITLSLKCDTSPKKLILQPEKRNKK